MNRPEFTREQENWLCYVLGDWYLEWKDKMTENNHPHMLGIAMSQLKDILCGDEPDKFIEQIVTKGCIL
jgi:hypothetical protein